MRGAYKIFRIFGIDIQIHYSWIFIFFLLSWSLASSYFPQISPGLNNSMYWFMGIVAALLLFVSVLLHELSHSLTAKAKKIGVESITLFFFGGVSGIKKEEMKPSSEFVMAVAGPLFSFVLAGIFYLLFRWDGNVIITAITKYLFQLNLILGIFNLVPGYPLDGGRALRAILYAYFKDLRKATRIAVTGGKIFAALLFVLGLIGLLQGLGNGLWFILLGGFLYFIAGASYEQVVIKEVLETFRIKELVKPLPELLNPMMKFSEFVKKYSNSEQDTFIVRLGNGYGLFDAKKVDHIPAAMQKSLTLEKVSVPFSKIGVL